MTAHDPLAGRLSCKVGEVVAFTGLSAVKVYDLIHRGAMPATKIGREWLVPVDAVRQLVDVAPDPRDEVVQDARDLVARTCAAQELPPEVEDPAALRQLAALVREAVPT